MESRGVRFCCSRSADILLLALRLHQFDWRAFCDFQAQRLQEEAAPSPSSQGRPAVQLDRSDRKSETDAWVAHRHKGAPGSHRGAGGLCRRRDGRSGNLVGAATPACTSPAERATATASSGTAGQAGATTGSDMPDGEAFSAASVRIGWCGSNNRPIVRKPSYSDTILACTAGTALSGWGLLYSDK